MDVTLPISTGDAERVLLVPREDGRFASVGVVAEVSQTVRLPGGLRATALKGLHRAIAGAAHPDSEGNLRVEIDERPDENPPREEVAELEKQYRAVVAEILDLRGDDGRIASFVRAIEDPGTLADTSGYSPDLSYTDKVELLETFDVKSRLARALELQRGRLTELQLRKRIRDDVDSGSQKAQKEYVLRRQMDAIRKELGEDDNSVIEEYREKIAEAKMPDNAREQAEIELGRLERMGDASPESQQIRTYLDWMVSLPWSKRSQETLDPRNAREVLDADHAGLDDVKQRITDYLAVRKLRKERGIEIDRRAGVILTLVGPPGTGKTSIGESVARATGREFVRIALGGVRDEAEIRGHRRTYIGSMPGRLVRALRDAGTMNPVILLDEVDKLGNDWRGDPSAALLEVLDPAQNHTFRDHYLDVEIDLSQVLFIATANVVDTIPAPLLDRMEVIRFDGYTLEEKTAIARDYLWPRQLRHNALREGEVEIDNPLLRLIIDEYTREAGVRQLEREIGKLLRKTATKIALEPDTVVEIDEAAIRDALGRQKFFTEAAARVSVPGVATGLAVTGAGGDVLFVEVATMPGKGGLVLTGQLGDVMKESAQIALSYVRSHAAVLGIDKNLLRDREFHIHVPAGAIPKDGPSAGITIVTALVSLLTGRPVRNSVGMTGEVTLQGRVLPIGGLKQKVLAAHAAGLTGVVLPERNAPDLEDVPLEVRNAMRFYPAATIDEVLRVALVGDKEALAA
jgi:ATP-dependent Lon protease